jgi:hypothetical protein
LTRRLIPLVISIVVGLLTIFDYFLKVPAINDSASALRAWGVIVSTFALGLGTVNLIIIHGRRSMARTKKSWLSVVLLVGLAATAFSGIFAGAQGKSTVFIFDGIIQAVDQTLYSMLGVCICSAAYRAFRVHNVEASIMLVVGVLVLLAQIPTAIALAPGLIGPQRWIMNTLNVAGQRGIVIASGVAFIALSLRVILGLDRTYMGTD